MKILIHTIILVCMLAASGQIRAGTAKVYWDDPKTFTDINPGVESRAKFIERVKKAIGQQFIKLAKKLPEGYTWEIQVSDIDLAGRVTSAYWGGREALRVLDTFYHPSITISYLVKDQAGKIVAGDKHFDLTDAYVKKYPSKRFMQRPFSYEKYMIKSWFDKVLLPFVENS